MADLYLQHLCVMSDCLKDVQKDLAREREWNFAAMAACLLLFLIGIALGASK